MVANGSVLTAFAKVIETGAAVDVEVLVAEIALAEEVEDPHAANSIAKNKPVDVSQLDFKARRLKSVLLRIIVTPRFDSQMLIRVSKEKRVTTCHTNRPLKIVNDYWIHGDGDIKVL